MKITKKMVLLLMLVLIISSTAASAGCLHVLNECYDLGGSDRICNRFYAACLQP